MNTQNVKIARRDILGRVVQSWVKITQGKHENWIYKFSLRRIPLGNWVILMFSGRKPFTRIISIILRSFLHFSRAMNVITKVKWNNSKSFKFHNESLRITTLPAFSQFLWNLKFIFSGSHKNLFSGVIPYNLLHWFIPLKKCKKERYMALNILVQGFCPLKIKVSQFPDGIRLNSFSLQYD